MADAKAKISITAENRTQKAFAQANAGMNKLAGQARAVGGALAGMMGVASFGMLAKQAINYGSALTDAAAATNTNVEALQVLTFKAQEAGASQENMKMALVRVQKSAVDARNGLATYSRAFNVLGINVQQFKNLRPEQMFEKIGQAVVKAKNKQDAYAAAMDILGTRNAPRLMEVLKDLGINGFDKAAEQAKAAGQVMEESTAQALDKAADAIERFKTRATIKMGEIISTAGSENGIKVLALRLMAAAADFGDELVEGVLRASHAMGRLYGGFNRGQGVRIENKLIPVANVIRGAIGKQPLEKDRWGTAEQARQRFIADYESFVGPEKGKNSAIWNKWADDLQLHLQNAPSSTGDFSEYLTGPLKKAQEAAAPAVGQAVAEHVGMAGADLIDVLSGPSGIDRALARQNEVFGDLAEPMQKAQEAAAPALGRAISGGLGGSSVPGVPKAAAVPVASAAAGGGISDLFKSAQDFAQKQRQKANELLQIIADNTGNNYGAVWA